MEGPEDVGQEEARRTPTTQAELQDKLVKKFAAIDLGIYGEGDPDTFVGNLREWENHSMSPEREKMMRIFIALCEAGKECITEALRYIGEDYSQEFAGLDTLRLDDPHTPFAVAYAAKEMKRLLISTKGHPFHRHMVAMKSLSDKNFDSIEEGIIERTKKKGKDVDDPAVKAEIAARMQTIYDKAEKQRVAHEKERKLATQERDATPEFRHLKALEPLTKLVEDYQKVKGQESTDLGKDTERGYVTEALTYVAQKLKACKIPFESLHVQLNLAWVSKEGGKPTGECDVAVFNEKMELVAILEIKSRENDVVDGFFQVSESDSRKFLLVKDSESQQYKSYKVDRSKTLTLVCVVRATDNYELQMSSKLKKLYLTMLDEEYVKRRRTYTDEEKFQAFRSACEGQLSEEQWIRTYGEDHLIVLTGEPIHFVRP